MIILTTEIGEAIFNEEMIIAVLPNEDKPHLTDVFIGEICVPVKENVDQILAMVNKKFN